MRITRIMLAGMLLMLAACGTPVPTTTTPAPATPVPPEPATPAAPPAATPVTPPSVMPSPVQPGLPPAPAGPGPNEVWAQNREFLPNVLTVPVGTKVTWVNKDVDVHTVTSLTTGLFDGSPGPSGGTFVYLFDKPGSYSYECGIHPGMAGKVIVQ